MNNLRRSLASLSPIKRSGNNSTYMFGIPQLNTTLNQSPLFTTSSRNKSLTFLRTPPNISTEINESISHSLRRSNSTPQPKKRLFNEGSNSNSLKKPIKKGKSSPKSKSPKSKSPKK